MPIRRQRGILTATIVCTAVLLPALGILQFRWIGEVGRAARQQIHSDLERSANAFREDFDEELRGALQPPQGGGPPGSGPQSPYISHAYIAARTPVGFALLELDRETHEMRGLDWPLNLDPIRVALEAGAPLPRDPSIAVEQLPGGPPPGGRGMFEPPPPRAGPRPPTRWRIAILDLDAIRQRLIPQLAKRYFGDGSTWAVRVLRTGEVYFQSSTSADFIHPDLELELLADPAGRGPANRADLGVCLLQIRRQGASLDDVVAATQRRDLLISFSGLGLLGVSSAFLILAARRSEKLAQLRMEFVAGISHELRTPIAVLASAADNLADGIVSPDSVPKYGALIRKEARRLSRMVDDVLTWSGLEHRSKPPNPQTLAVADIVAHSLAACRLEIDQAGCAVETTIPTELPAISGDPAWLEQALRNLIGNACKYGAAGKWLGVSAWQDATSVSISVADRGTGIERKDLARIFEPFYRAKSAMDAQKPGSGIGLSVVRRIAEAHGGTVDVSSAPGQGATFILRLPKESKS